MNRSIVALLTSMLCGALWYASAAATPEPPEYQSQQLERLFENYGEPGALRYRAWRQLIDGQQQSTIEQQVRAVNQHFNQYRFGSDQQIWGQSNYWATLMEFIGIGQGDCEEFALAKFLTLRQLGVPAEQLRMVYVKANQLNEHHMVVAWYPQPAAEPMLLDNLNGQLLPASQRPDLTPIFSFSGNQLWLANSQQRLQDAPALSLWSQFEQRRQRGQMRQPPYMQGVTQ